MNNYTICLNDLYYMLTGGYSYLDNDYRRRLVKQMDLSDEDKQFINKNIFDLLNFNVRNKLHFIVKISRDTDQRQQLNTIIQKMKEVGRDLKELYVSEKFCNTGYYEGNVLQYRIYEVIEHV